MQTTFPAGLMHAKTVFIHVMLSAGRLDPSVTPLKRNLRLLLVPTFLVFAVGICLFHLAWNGPADVDEGFYLAAGRAALEGGVPTIDFGYTQTPLFPFVLAPLVGCGGTSVWVFRLFCTGLTGAALFVMYRLTSERSGRGPALIAVAAFVSGLPTIYYSVVGRTFALVQLVVLLAAMVISFDGAVRRRWVLLTLLGVVAIGCRLTVTPMIGVLWLAFVLRYRRDLGWIWILGMPAVSLGVLCIPFFWADSKRAWFWMWQYHLMNERARHPSDFWLSVFRVSPVTVLLVLTVPVLAVLARAKVRWLGLVCCSAGAAGILTTVLFAGLHGEYIVPSMGLFLLGAVEVIGDLGDRRYWLLPILGIACGMAMGWPDLPKTGSTLHRSQSEAAAFLRKTIGPSDLVLAAKPEIAVAAERRLFPNLVMGVFAVTTDFDEQEAERLGLVHMQKLRQWVQTGVPAAIVFGAKDATTGGTFGGSMPSTSAVVPELLRQFWDGVLENYQVGFGNEYYLVLIRKGPPIRSGAVPTP